MTTTMKDIAERLNVSVVTVSKAFKNKSDISKKTRNLILKTAKELNYTQNILARSLLKKKTDTLGVLISNIENLFFAEIVNGIETLARKNKYNILLGNTDNNPNIEYNSIKMFFEKRVDGLLICPTQKNNRYIKILKTSDIPFVFLSRHTDLLKCNYVINDNVYGAYLAVNHLIKRGYKEIYYICKHIESSTFRERTYGCEKAIDKNKVKLNKFKTIHCGEDIDSFYNAVKKNIDYKGNRIGLYVWNDHMALGVYKAIIDKGLKIPEEVGIIGYDDVEYSKYLHTPLTTIQNPGFEMGTKGTEIIIERIKSKDLSKIDEIILKPKLVARGTT